MKLTLPDKEITFKRYTLRDHMNILVSKINSDSELMKKAYSEVLGKCIGQKLNKHESEFALINIIAKSDYEDKVIQNYTCDCGVVIPAEIKIENAYIDFAEESIDELYSFKKFKVKFKWPDLWADDDIVSMILKSIEAIYVGNERIEIDDLNDAEMDDLIEAISETDINNITKKLLAPKPVLPVSVKCPACGKSHSHVLIGFKQFIEVL